MALYVDPTLFQSKNNVSLGMSSNTFVYRLDWSVVRRLIQRSFFMDMMSLQSVDRILQTSMYCWVMETSMCCIDPLCVYGVPHICETIMFHAKHSLFLWRRPYACSWLDLAMRNISFSSSRDTFSFVPLPVAPPCRPPLSPLPVAPPCRPYMSPLPEVFREARFCGNP